MKRVFYGVTAALVMLSASSCKLIFGDGFLACIGNGPLTFKSAAFNPPIVEISPGSPAVKLTLETVDGCAGFPPSDEAVTLSPKIGTVSFKNFELRYTPPATLAAPTDVTLTVKLQKYRTLTDDPPVNLEPSVTLRLKP